MTVRRVISAPWIGALLAGAMMISHWAAAEPPAGSVAIPPSSSPVNTVPGAPIAEVHPPTPSTGGDSSTPATGTDTAKGNSVDIHGVAATVAAFLLGCGAFAAGISAFRSSNAEPYAIRQMSAGLGSGDSHWEISRPLVEILVAVALLGGALAVLPGPSAPGNGADKAGKVREDGPATPLKVSGKDKDPQAAQRAEVRKTEPN